MRKLFGAAGAVFFLLSSAGVMADEASPYVVGVWEFKQGSRDTDFKFINPTNLDLRLEYAFFSADGKTFCGCDADEFEANKTVEYTMADEVREKFFDPVKCGSAFGAVKSIAFQQTKGGDINLDGALQVGFQERLGGSQQQNVLAEFGLKAIPLTPVTRAEIRKIHLQCK